MQKMLQDLHISHEQNESENIPILVEERWDAFRGIPNLELLPLLLLLISRPPRSSNTSSTQNLNELLVAGLVKMAMKSHHVLLQHYCIIINKHYPLYAITILWPQVKEASTRIQTYANNEAITAICENRTVCKDSNIHHTSVTLTILKN